MNTKQRVQSLLSEGKTGLEIAEKLGVSAATVSYHRKTLGLEVRTLPKYDWVDIAKHQSEGHSIGECCEKYGCSRETWNQAVKRGVVKGARYEYRKGTHTVALRRMLRATGVDITKCSICGQGNMWNSKPLTLQVHHINGCRTDNTMENLQILCPNCHTQTDNYAAKNRQNNHEVK